MAAAAAATGRTEAHVLADLRRLVTVDKTGISRRRVALANPPAPVQAELGIFVTHRLVTTTSSTDSGDPAGGTSAPGPFLAFAHEQILTAWPPLAAAVAAEADTLRVRTSADDAADAWDRAGQPTDHLWEPSRATSAANTLLLLVTRRWHRRRRSMAPRHQPRKDRNC